MWRMTVAIYSILKRKKVQSKIHNLLKKKKYKAKNCSEAKTMWRNTVTIDNVSKKKL